MQKKLKRVQEKICANIQTCLLLILEHFKFKHENQIWSVMKILLHLMSIRTKLF